MSRSERGPDYGLQIFEKHPNADAYRVGAGFTGYAILAVEKRFTDAELAAEVFFAVFHESECELRGRKLALRVGEDHPAVEHYAAQNREFARQAPIFERFATLPHFDE